MPPPSLSLVSLSPGAEAAAGAGGGIWLSRRKSAQQTSRFAAAFLAAALRQAQTRGSPGQLWHAVDSVGPQPCLAAA